MRVELWGLGGGPNFQIPLRWSGIVILVVEGIVILSLILFHFRRINWRVKLRSRWHWLILLFLIVISPIASEALLVRLPLSETVVIPGVSLEPKSPSFSVFGALPWMLAAGLLGQWQAVVVALVGGLARGGWETFRILTPFHFMLQAALVAWLLRRDYMEWAGRAARNPIVAGIIGGFVLGLLQTVELFEYSGGSLYDGLDYALTLVNPTIIAATIETLFAGAICEIIRSAEVDAWYRPQTLVVGPYNRSLAARLVTVFLILGVIASTILLYGDWLLAQTSARDLVERQMRHTASQAGGAIPYFIQTGRNYSQRIAGELNQFIVQESLSTEILATQLRADTFFNRLAVFDSESELLMSYPASRGLRLEIPREITVSLRSVLRGVPEEVVLEPDGLDRAAQLAFLSPIQTEDDEGPIGAVVAWTDLASNPLMSPVVSSLEKVFPGEAFITDGHGLILLHPSAEQEMRSIDLDLISEEQVQVETAQDGTRLLVYTLPVEGYPWQVIVTTPMREVQRQALQIAARLTFVLFAVGMLVVGMVYALSRRLTEPLRMMANVARSIARGNLAEAVTSSGEDEIGQLAVSFEQMRQRLKSRLDEMTLLLSVSQHVASGFELSDVLPPILHGVAKITDADVVRLALLPIIDDENVPVEAYQVGEDPGNWSSLDSQVMDLCQQRGRFTLENPSRARTIIDVHFLTKSIESLAALPISHEEQFVGALWLGHQVPRVYAPDEINLLSIIASQLGIAVSNAHLYHRAEQERTQLTAVLEWTPDAVIVIDQEGRISLANPASAFLFRGEVSEAIGMPATDWLTTDELLDLLMAPGQDIQTAEIEIDPGRVMFAAIADINPEEGESSSRLCILRDITHYKKLDAVKSEFVSTVSHDLRAPLTLMRGYATMLSMVGAMNDQQKDFMDKILTSVDQMGTLVDNLLDLGRIEAGLGLDLEAVDIEEFIAKVIDSYRPQAVNKQISIDVDIADGMESVEADRTLMRQAVANILDNAIRYTAAEGKVSIRVTQENSLQLIAIKDTGVGIAPTDQARLFEKFYRARRREGDRETGLGLGLAIVKSIVEQHGGQISVESRLGEGSTFTIAIPIRSPLLGSEVRHPEGREGA
ncbi:MAG TPA: HAMP domain-containing protein [Anaerolineae bacterium]|nr:HAMP domain-containing protein [Anaerolineae bacterium]